MPRVNKVGLVLEQFVNALDDVSLVLPKFGVMNHKLLYSYSYEVIASTISL